ncbi:hypothetical protein H5410_014883 [Solanum commersonii]|uniref:FBD domain-containing protein n=1 Tax=Solanum commersonii TaxID=4109 RepID=A0A9J5ZSI1_SOLCO|nr:hypothetical protein H5410_014883 [Solanum commersonii]
MTFTQFFFVNLSNARELFFREESYYEEGRFITWSLLYLCPNLARLVLINSCIQFEGKQFELIFVKKILAYFPSLSRMIVKPFDYIDVGVVLDLYEELMMSLKASERVKVIVAPHGEVT